MKTITIRQLQQNLYASLAELPLVVTKNGQPYITIQHVATSPTSKPADIERCTFINRHGIQCSSKPLEGKTVCYNHQSQA